MTPAPPGFISGGSLRREQEAQKSLRTQGPEEGQGLSTRLARNNSSVVHRHKRCSISSGAYCGVPISGRSRRQTTMYEIDTTEQVERNGERTECSIWKWPAGAIFSNPSSWGEPCETLFYIPPANKGDVIYGIAGAGSVSASNSTRTPHAKGSIETVTVRGSWGGRCD
jgi:hypothetical protein